MSFLRRFSFSSQKSTEENSVTLLFKLENKDQDRLEEINKNFTHRDAELFAPELVKDMNWERFKERVLDCGCGTGKTGFTHFLPQIYMHDSLLYSVDASESLISYASMKYPHPSASYAQGDVLSENFPYKFITFDKIFALHVLQCIKDYGSVAILF
jgi:2-polyprenyl-3-methyl-5-hydroxy-6-metoxy-1,4-benzoquinol methylase